MTTMTTTPIDTPIDSIAPTALGGMSQHPALLGSWLTEFWFGRTAASDVGRMADSLFLFIFWISVFFFFLLMGLMVWWTWKYRRRPGVAAPKSANHNTALEVTWTVLPSFLLLIIFIWGFKGYVRQHVVEANPIRIDITAVKWNWSAQYPNGQTSALLTRNGSVDIPIFVIPVDTPIEFSMVSTDVIHSFWIPDFRVKLDVFPNRYTTQWLRAEETGDHWIFCAEYCGDQHSEMGAILRVVERSEYDKFLETGGVDFGELPPAAAGKILAASKGCVSCHAFDQQAKTGPGWGGIYGETHRFTDGTTAVVDDNYLREAILYPGVKIVEGYGNNMTPYAGVLKEEEIRYLIHFIRGLQEDGTLSEEALGAAPGLDNEEGASDDAPAETEG